MEITQDASIKTRPLADVSLQVEITQDASIKTRTLADVSLHVEITQDASIKTRTLADVSPMVEIISHGYVETKLRCGGLLLARLHIVYRWQTSNGRWRLSSSVTLHSMPARGFTRTGHAMTSCRSSLIIAPR